MSSSILIESRQFESKAFQFIINNNVTNVTIIEPTTIITGYLTAIM